MTESQIATVDRMFEFNLWANITVMEICRGLSDEQLEFEVEGAYGGIRKFLTHIVRAEAGYIRRLTGSSVWEGDLNWDDLPVDTIIERAQLTGQKLIDIASKTNPDVSFEVERQTGNQTYYNWTVMVQAIMHGIEHRTHVKVLLTQLGVEHPDLSMWGYTESLG